ncbi:MAG: hypothetical protein RL577_1056, partial [Bacteroidota bacterium]
HPAQRGVRVVEGARLESVYTPKAYRGFESLPLCKTLQSPDEIGAFFMFKGQAKYTCAQPEEHEKRLRSSRLCGGLILPSWDQ